jgi:hypothetical protein
LSFQRSRHFIPFLFTAKKKPSAGEIGI